MFNNKNKTNVIFNMIIQEGKFYKKNISEENELRIFVLECH